MHGVCEFGVTGELLADPGTLVAEVISILAMSFVFNMGMDDVHCTGDKSDIDIE